MRLAPAAALLLCAAPPSGLAAQASPAALGVTYRLAAESRLEVRVGRAGLLAAAGHEHLIRAGRFEGSITFRPDEPARDSVAVTVETEALYVVPEADSADIPRITATMRDQVLQVRAHPTIAFASTSVAATERGVHVEGTLTMLGRSRPVAFDAELRLVGDTLVGTASFAVRQSAFGIRPVSKALGLVRVADEVRFELHLVGVRQE